MTIQIRRHADARSFSEHARAWLLQSEAEHNLLLTVIRQLRSGAHSYVPPFYLATVERDGSVCGCAIRTPPFKFVVTDMPLGVMPPLIDDVGLVYSALPAVLGPESVASAFASAWSQRIGGTWAAGMRQRIYQLDQVTWPARRAPGQLRRAVPKDLDLVRRWSQGFVDDTGVPDRPAPLADRLIDSGALYMWEDGEPKSMAARAGETPNGVRVGFVYTPRALRGRGYASMCVASLSDRLLEEGSRFCFLFTDLANPTSNHIYQRIGYRPVCDVVDCTFSPAVDRLHRPQ